MNIFKDTESFSNIETNYPIGVVAYGRFLEFTNKFLSDLGVPEEFNTYSFYSEDISKLARNYQELAEEFEKENFLDELNLTKKLEIIEENRSEEKVYVFEAEYLLKLYNHILIKKDYEQMDWDQKPISRENLGDLEKKISFDLNYLLPSKYHEVKYGFMNWDQEVIPRSRAIFDEQSKNWSLENTKDVAYSLQEAYTSVIDTFYELQVKAGAQIDEIQKNLDSGLYYVKKVKLIEKEFQGIKEEVKDISDLVDESKETISKEINILKVGDKFRQVGDSLIYGSILTGLSSAAWSSANQFGDYEGFIQYGSALGFIAAVSKVFHGFRYLSSIKDVLKNYTLDGEGK